MKITAEFNSNEELVSFISTFGTTPVAAKGEVKVETTKKKATKKDKVEEPKEEKVVDETPTETVDIEIKEAKKKEEPKIEPKEEIEEEIEEQKEEASDSNSNYTKDDLARVAKTKLKEGKNTEVKVIFEKYGATKLSEIKEEDYDKCIPELEVL